MLEKIGITEIASQFIRGDCTGSSGRDAGKWVVNDGNLANQLQAPVLPKPQNCHHPTDIYLPPHTTHQHSSQDYPTELSRNLPPLIVDSHV